MDGQLKDRAFNVIQRDRLSDLFKTIDEKASGCFYQSLVNVYHSLNPGAVLPRSFENSVLQRNPDLIVRWRDVIARIQELEDVLHLDVTELVVLPGALNTKDQVSAILTAPPDIPVSKAESFTVKSGPDIAALICWRNNTVNEAGKFPSHVSSDSSATIVWHEYRGVGGEMEKKLLERKGYFPSMIFYIQRLTTSSNLV